VVINVDPSREQEGQDGLGGLVRRVLAAGPTPEERLEELLAERRRELDETAARFDASLADLERREELLRDSRASVERMLRLGRKELDARESELADSLRALAEREASLARAEGGMAQRRQELGAVELKRAAVERRERDVAEREELLTRAVPAAGIEQGTETAELAFVPGPAYRLVEVTLPNAGAGTAVELEGEELVVSRVGPSPLPGDSRRCAYLTR
jgi:hypothetical protein